SRIARSWLRSTTRRFSFCASSVSTICWTPTSSPVRSSRSGPKDEPFSKGKTASPGRLSAVCASTTATAAGSSATVNAIETKCFMRMRSSSEEVENGVEPPQGGTLWQLPAVQERGERLDDLALPAAHFREEGVTAEDV